MRIFLMTLLLVSVCVKAQDDMSDDAHRMQHAREHMLKEHGDATFSMLMVDQLENRYDDGSGSLAWKAQGWFGKDLEKFWFKTEGEGYADSKQHGESELQLLYGKAVSSYWDLQLGWRRDFLDGEDQDYAVLGLQGLAPYWFEMDLAAFISEDGDTSLRLEAEYELLLTQRLILQPHLETDWNLSQDNRAGTGRGFNELTLGLRLRYEIRKTFAPYVGVNHVQVHGDGASQLRVAGSDTRETRWVAGLRFWY